MAGPRRREDGAPADVPQEALDPAAERVRRKLVRFMGINLAILFAAVMAVALAFVYKSLSPQEAALPAGDAVTGTLDLPEGARIVSQALEGTRLSLHVALAGGGAEIRVYDLRDGRLIALYRLGE